ncbi:efflux ABC transporter, permease protein [Lachnoanaerobaculum saburreum F0468]|uniref:Efflux ABC transporter, permease protein n=1 Tax=Lachnoanaerobaculum saburreum F0468 TaxID=1095750 RepID=I0R4J8_9FIRM|nr:ABC transporter permease [Lachnoanaerobaculum saburreum]EIC94606.1 efflux ABC transporter, permease protein [Lachnoanaerobaculum saburreum F0468]
MTLFNFAYNNIKRDFKNYLYHFLSCVFSVFIFFLFSTLAKHPALKIVESGSTIGIILFMASIVSMLFSFVLILYSVSNFLRNRSKQFAILNIIGASKGQFNKLIFFENIIISIFALLVGIITGIIFSKIFLMIAQSMIDGLNLYFYFPLIPLLLTVFLMGGLFLLISLIAPVILRKKRIIDLLKKEELAEKNYFLLSLAAVIVILSPTIYFHIKKEFFTFIYILDLLSCISTSYFIFNLIFNVYNFFMEKSGRIYVNNNLIKLSNFKYKVNTNIKTMAATMILFSIILTAFVYIVGAPMNVTEDTEKIMPYSYMYANWEDEAEGERKAKLIADELKSADGFKKLTISYAELKNKARTVRHIILSNTMYNEVADFLNREKINLSDNEYFLVGVDGKSKPILPDVVKNEISDHGITKEIGTDKRIISVSGYFTSVTVISDKSYESISSALVKDRIYAFTQSDLTNGGSEDLANIKKLIGFEEGKESLISYIFYYDFENLTRRLVSYVGSILCISFLIGIASIIYSRLYSSVEEESKKYSIMIKMGLSKAELKDILASTLRWLFILPFITALIISWIIISIMNQMIVTSYTNLTIICSFIYLLTEFILYMTIKRKYQEKILNNI